MQDRLIYLIAAAVALSVGILSYSFVLGHPQAAAPVAAAPAGQASPGLGTQLAFLGSTVNSLANDPNAPIPTGLPGTVPPEATPAPQTPAGSPNLPAQPSDASPAPGPAPVPAAAPASAPSAPVIEQWDKLPRPGSLSKDVQ
jgi:hypothetical protein